jgi:predicted amidohydrolase YtcJ
MNVPTLGLRNVEVDDRAVDALVAGGRVHEVGVGLDMSRTSFVVDGLGGALLPGLHDHHVHLCATAAAARSVDISRHDRDGFVAALRTADGSLPPGAWMRVIGYHESLHGPLDRVALDAVVNVRPVRVQHATGAMWVLNTAAVAAVQLDRGPHDRVERAPDGGVTGRAFGLDDWLFRQWPKEPPDLERVGRELTAYGITGVTDMTPYRDDAHLEALRNAAETGALRQRIVATGAPALPRARMAPLVRGPAKIVVDDYAPPDVDVLYDEIASAHILGFPVALHCASRLGLVLAVAALEETQSVRGDRIEHGAVIPPELFARLRALGVTVVTQPAFVPERGDRYLADAPPEDVAHLWRCGTLIAHGIPVGFGSDAPHGPLDPWLAIRAATERRTCSGRELGDAERVSARDALARFLSPWDDPGGPPRRVRAGETADLCLLHAPLEEALRTPSAEAVRLTIIKGAIPDE